jgi:7-cyano-7-deazaguanine synthase
MSDLRGRCAVLLSGGVDSALLLGVLQDQGWLLRGVFVDYSQAALESEGRASAAVAEHFGITWRKVSVPALIAATPGELPHRNDVLVSLAAAANPGWSIGIGIHSGTGYADCTIGWLENWRQLLALQNAGEVTVVAPFVHMTKGDIYSLSRDVELPVALTYSCESGNEPCGDCNSCRDRRSLDAGA